MHALNGMASTRTPHEQAVKAVIHCDVDCFYCQVEVIDNPALAGRPLAVHQGNSGGFVAVNYQVWPHREAYACCDPQSLTTVSPDALWLWTRLY